MGIDRIFKNAFFHSGGNFCSSLAKNMYSMINKKIFFYYFTSKYLDKRHGEKFINKVCKQEEKYHRTNNNQIFDLLIKSFPIKEVTVNQEKCIEWIKFLNNRNTRKPKINLNSSKIDRQNLPEEKNIQIIIEKTEPKISAENNNNKLKKYLFPIIGIAGGFSLIVYLLVQHHKKSKIAV